MLLLENAAILHLLQPSIDYRPKAGVPLMCTREYLPEGALSTRLGEVVLRERLD